jgi:hypothetical protein
MHFHTEQDYSTLAIKIGIVRLRFGNPRAIRFYAAKREIDIL